MKIWSYILTCPDDVDTLPDALNSLSFSDRIYLIDGGNVSLIHHPRYTAPVKQWLDAQPEYNNSKWNDIPLTIFENEFVSYGPQRNYILSLLEREPDRADFLVWIDADEVCSDQMRLGMRDYLSTLPEDCEGAYVKWLNLVQDEEHCVGGHHSDWLAHPRIVKIGNHHFSGSVHEHMIINRDKLERWPVRVCHTRALFRHRLLVQRSHPMIRHQPDPLWDDAQIERVPDGVTWTLHWPSGEFPIDVDADARDYWSV